MVYFYIGVAVIAGAIIATYTRYTANLSLIRLILATNAIILSNIAFFWFLLTFFDPGWSHYAFYIWSAMVSVIAKNIPYFKTGKKLRERLNAGS